MKRIFFIGLLLTLLLCSGAVHAQRQFRKPLKSTNQSILGFSNYNIGIKMGCPWSYMGKSDLKTTSYDGHFGYLVGIIGERNIGRFSLSLESTFAQKGNRMHNSKPYQISLSQVGTLNTRYELVYNVVTLRVPVTYYFKGMVKDDKIIPYVFAGPEADIALSEVTAVIKQFDGPNGDQPLDPVEQSFKPGLNIGMVAGLGFMTKVRFENSAVIFKFEAAYNRGLMNLSEPTKTAWKWPFEQQDPLIFAHNAEASLSIILPIKKILHDACYNFRK